MEDHTVVARVGVVMMETPSGGCRMDLDIAAEPRGADAYDGPEKIGAAVGIWYAGVAPPAGAGGAGGQGGGGGAVPFPDPVEGRFREAGHLPEVLVAVTVDLIAECMRCRPCRFCKILARGGEEDTA
jgi:hypothetical protein